MENVRYLNAKRCRLVPFAEVGPATRERALRLMESGPGRNRKRPGYWLQLSKRLYAYREHTGEVTLWREMYL